MMKKILIPVICMCLSNMAVSCNSKINLEDYMIPQKMEEYEAVPVSDFLASVGVNCSIEGRGENADSTYKYVNYLGVRWLRSGVDALVEGGVTKHGTPNPEQMEHRLKLHRELGIKFSLMLNPSDENFATVLEAARILHRNNAFIAFEGVNEPNNWSIEYKGEKGGGGYTWLPIAKMHNDFYELAKADPELKDYPVWSVSEVGAENDNVGLQYLTVPEGTGCLMPAGTRFADACNCHNYFIHPSFDGINNNQTWRSADPTTNCPVDGLANNFGTTWAKGYAGYTDGELLSIHRVTTETGITLDGSYTDWDGTRKTQSLGITEEVQALMYMSCYLSQFARGWDNTSIYIFRDRIDEAGNQTFGFFGSHWVQESQYHYTYEPRRSAVYMHNLTHILDDDNPVPVPSKESYILPSKPYTVHHILMQKSTGQMCLVVWDERFEGGTDDVEIRFSRVIDKIKVYDPTAVKEFDYSYEYSGQRIHEDIDALYKVNEFDNVSSISLKMSNHPLIIMFEPKKS